MATVEIFQVLPREEDQPDNPYVAWISPSSEYELGEIRIEPPCHFSDSALETISSNLEVIVDCEVIGTNASLYEFTVDPSFGIAANDDVKIMGYEDRIIHTVQNMLSKLGKTANADLLQR